MFEVDGFRQTVEMTGGGHPSNRFLARLFGNLKSLRQPPVAVDRDEGAILRFSFVHILCSSGPRQFAIYSLQDQNVLQMIF